MSTEYTVEIPAGTKSTNGGTLSSTKRWTFSTSLLEVKSRYPDDDDDEQPRDPLIFIEFDQRIDPAAALKFISLSSNNHEWPLRLATAEEIKANDDVNTLSSNAVKDHWMAFRVGKDPVKSRISFFRPIPHSLFQLKPARHQPRGHVRPR